ncbi:DUF4367 domain-containing protein [Anaerotignum sp. MB30-C6]|uniref:DUF4367 domain-containing protein n=1 Tax=Anaerotignum sp. MB30-C6 TaxID=3070814 RepID=UPI0027DBAC53|nr:DUF4367 domain-containing protein [Anaerotignum sp. MB30-C6]WMI81618.1 DUF4367 domain-containing protein [Anaerotignum sp. MB30-C6]
MSEKFEELLELAAIASFDKEVRRNPNWSGRDYVEVILGKKQQIELAKKILLLPPKGMFVLFSEFCFYLRPLETEVFFGIENVKGYTFYYQKLLSLVMGLEEGQIISNESMEPACKRALQKYIKKEFYAEASQITSYQPRIKVGFKKVVKKVAVATLIAAMSFSMMMVANAEFREKVISWAIEIFEKYSIFELNSDEAQTIENLQKYAPSYIPSGFKLDNTVNQPSLILFEYSNGNSNYLDILMSISDTRVYMDTEGVSVEELEMLGSTAYYYNKDDVKCIIFEKDGFHFEVYGSIRKEDLIMVAEGIKSQ